MAKLPATQKVDPRTIDIDSLTAEQSNDLIMRLRTHLDTLHTKAREKARQAALDAIAAHGLRPDDLAALLGVKKSSAPRYRDPSTGKTWSGRGRTPAWVDKATMAVNEDGQPAEQHAA